MKNTANKWQQFKQQMTEKYGLDWLTQSLTGEDYHNGLLALNDITDVTA